MDTAEEEREVKDLLRMANNDPDRSCRLRNDTLTRLINLAHSPSPTLKILVATSIPFLFKDFPDLEEQAINAIYDICEDQSSKVRIEGYGAITQISKAESRWIKRNVDVLVQLLQSDEPEEVAVVKKSLIEHLHMDPRVTLGVLCDQLTPPNVTTDEEDRAIRDRLRSLVLAFLIGEAKQMVERSSTTPIPLEEVLVETLLTTINRLDYPEVEVIVKDLLLSLPSYQKESPKSQALLQILLSKVSNSVRYDLRSSKPATLRTSRPYLELAHTIVLERQIAPVVDLFQYYCISLTGKMLLQQLSQPEQAWVITHIADILAFCRRYKRDADSQTQRWKIVDACPYLLETLVSAVTERAGNDACIAILQACVDRKDLSSWTVPLNLTSVLMTLQVNISRSPHNEQQNMIRELISSLLLPSKPVLPLHSQPEEKRQNIASQRSSIMQRLDQHPPELSKSIPESSRSGSALRNVGLSHPPSKRRKSDTTGEVSHGPSLLSRLDSVSIGPIAREWSIKGAASATTALEQRGFEKNPPQPLLGRLQDAMSPETSGPPEYRKRKRENQ